MDYNDIINNKFKKIQNFDSLNKDILQTCFDLSSEGDLNNSRINEENFNNNLETDLKTNLKEEKIIITKRINNEYKIENIHNFFIFNHRPIALSNNINEKSIKIDENNIIESKKRGRKRKKTEINEDNEQDKKKHDKYSDDNMRKKCKNIILKYTLQFINKKIKEKYNGIIGIGEHKKELKILKQEDKIKSTVDIDKIFFEKTLKDIFSEEISSRFNGFLPTHNKTIIELLINESDEEKKEFFNKLFNLTFLDCLKCFRGDKVNIKELNGFKKFVLIQDEIIKKNDKEYADMLLYYLRNFQEIINNKKSRKTQRKVKFNPEDK